MEVLHVYYCCRIRAKWIFVCSSTGISSNMENVIRKSARLSIRGNWQNSHAKLLELNAVLLFICGRPQPRCSQRAVEAVAHEFKITELLNMTVQM